ncbi:unnamed protein product [Sphenostylis stenocarpa]|uniref:Uncharacterized protein n=1 Tax=Sphenostylis stenocarpa TaxID=92480 RepID=A0AA86T3X9_9FABA|nr:unnamed protein product [Sphenostylis stenocarpa]
MDLASEGQDAGVRWGGPPAPPLPAPLLSHHPSLSTQPLSNKTHLLLLTVRWCRPQINGGDKRRTKAFNTVLSDAKGKNENFGELEDVYKKGHNEDTPRAARNAWQRVATETVEVEGGRATRGKKRMRKKRVEEKMVSFFKRLVKRVVKQQEVLQNKLVAAIERMEKERVEWEEGWRRREAEIHDREALMKARERDLASERDSSIVSSIEKITGQRFVLVSGKGHDQLSPRHEN